MKRSELKQIIKEVIEESNILGKTKLKIYHGDNFGLTDINSNFRLMSLENSNQQEGPGIYFSTNKETAEHYGSKVVSIEIDLVRFMSSREKISKYLSTKVIKTILMNISENDDKFLDILSDYGEDVSSYSKVPSLYWDKLSKMMGIEQVRNFLITLCEYTSVENVITSFTNNCAYYGTQNKQNEDNIWFAVFKTDSHIIEENLKSKIQQESVESEKHNWMKHVQKEIENELSKLNARYSKLYSDLLDLSDSGDFTSTDVSARKAELRQIKIDEHLIKKLYDNVGDFYDGFKNKSGKEIIDSILKKEK